MMSNDRISDHRSLLLNLLFASRFLEIILSTTLQMLIIIDLRSIETSIWNVIRMRLEFGQNLLTKRVYKVINLVETRNGKLILQNSASSMMSEPVCELSSLFRNNNKVVLMNIDNITQQ